MQGIIELLDSQAVQKSMNLKVCVHIHPSSFLFVFGAYVSFSYTSNHLRTSVGTNILVESNE